MDRREREKLYRKKILFVAGAHVTEIHSELYCPQCVKLSESEDMRAITAAIEDADIVYLYEVSAQKRNDLIIRCYTRNKCFYCTMDLADPVIGACKISRDYDSPVLCHDERAGLGVQEAIKRAADVLCSLLALVLLSPVMLIVALGIKAEDGGPVIYRQTRCTKGGRQFQIYKFRSMIPDAEHLSGAVLSNCKDPRLTRIGRILRNTKIDELPQLINIIKGDMSIVGPRPERPELIEEAVKNTPEFLLRMRVKAGLTGYAQVYGNYNTEFAEKLKWDLLYIENWSLLRDLKMILLTIPVTMRKENHEDHSKWEVDRAVLEER